jgi:hypothetical protein
MKERYPSYETSCCSEYRKIDNVQELQWSGVSCMIVSTLPITVSFKLSFSPLLEVYRRFEGIYCLYLQCWSVSRERRVLLAAWFMPVPCLSYFSSLNMEAVCSVETSVNIYRTTWRNIQGDSTFQISAVFIFWGVLCDCSKDISMEILHLSLCVRLVAYLPTCLHCVQVTSPWESLS